MVKKRPAIIIYAIVIYFFGSSTFIRFSVYPGSYEHGEAELSGEQNKFSQEWVYFFTASTDTLLM